MAASFKANPYHGDELCWLSSTKPAKRPKPGQKRRLAGDNGGRSQRLSGTYSRWIRAYMLVKTTCPCLPPEMGTGSSADSPPCTKKPQTISAQYSPGGRTLSLTGMAFNKPDWRER